MSELAGRFTGRRAVVALSGGPDSAAVAVLAARHALTARAVHVNHHRPASPQMQKAAEAVAADLRIALDVVDVDVPDGPDWEARARQARYDVMLAGLADDEVLLTGHTRDDQAETVLLNLLRGAGSAGLGGMPDRRSRIERPLLTLSKAAAAHLAANLPTAADPDNDDEAFARNRIRHGVMADLEKARPGASERLARSARLLSADDAELRRRSSMVPLRRGSTEIRVALAWLRTLPPPLSARVIRRTLTDLRPPHPPSLAEVDRIVTVVEGSVRATELAGGFVAYRSGAALVVEAVDRTTPPAPVRLSVGATRFGPWRFECAERQERPSALPLSPHRAVVDADAVGDLVVRALRPGDVIDFGSGHKSAADACQEAGVPSERRQRHPVVVSGEAVVWIPGVRRGQLGWVSGATRRYLCIDSIEEGTWTSDGS